MTLIEKEDQKVNAAVFDRVHFANWKDCLSTSFLSYYFYVYANFFGQGTNLKVPSFALLFSRYIFRLGQTAQKQQRPRCPNLKMYLEIRRADERLLNVSRVKLKCISLLGEN